MVEDIAIKMASYANSNPVALQNCKVNIPKIAGRAERTRTSDGQRCPKKLLNQMSNVSSAGNMGI